MLLLPSSIPSPTSETMEIGSRRVTADATMIELDVVCNVT